MNVPELAAVGEIIKIKSGILENLLKRKQKKTNQAICLSDEFS